MHARVVPAALPSIAMPCHATAMPRHATPRHSHKCGHGQFIVASADLVAATKIASGTITAYNANYNAKHKLIIKQQQQRQQQQQQQ